MPADCAGVLGRPPHHSATRGDDGGARAARLAALSFAWLPDPEQARKKTLDHPGHPGKHMHGHTARWDGAAGALGRQGRASRARQSVGRGAASDVPAAASLPIGETKKLDVAAVAARWMGGGASDQATGGGGARWGVHRPASGGGAGLR